MSVLWAIHLTYHCFTFNIHNILVCVCVCVCVCMCIKVRWADLEAKKDTERKRREVGFCIGGSWGQVTDEEAHAILTGTNTTDTS